MEPKRKIRNKNKRYCRDLTCTKKYALTVGPKPGGGLMWATRSAPLSFFCLLRACTWTFRVYFSFYLTISSYQQAIKEHDYSFYEKPSLCFQLFREILFLYGHKRRIPLNARTFIGSLSMQRFLATEGHRKCAVFLFYLSSHYHIYIFKFLCASRDDYFENLGETFVLACKVFTSGCRPWLKNVACLSFLLSRLVLFIFLPTTPPPTPAGEWTGLSNFTSFCLFNLDEKLPEAIRGSTETKSEIGKTFFSDMSKRYNYKLNLCLSTLLSLTGNKT